MYDHGLPLPIPFWLLVLGLGALSALQCPVAAYATGRALRSGEPWCKLALWAAGTLASVVIVVVVFLVGID